MPRPPVKAVPWHEAICKVEREPENTEFYYKDINVIEPRKATRHSGWTASQGLAGN